MSFTVDDLDRLASLARLHLTDEERSRFAEQLSSILEYVQKIQDVDCAGIADEFHLRGLTNVTEEDAVNVYADNNPLISSAPRREDGHIKVRSVRDAR